METTAPVPERTRKTRGRPSGPEAENVRHAILDSAESLFAARGYAATSVREIAEEVGVNPAMVHYYFGSKHALLQQVLERTLEPLANAIAEMKDAGRAPVSDIIGLLLGAFSADPNLPYLVMREVMLPGGIMQHHFLEYLAPRLGGAVPGLLAREQAEGRMRPDLDPGICTLMMLSLCAFPFVARQLAEPGLKLSYDAAGLDSLEMHINQLLSEGFSR